MRCITLFLLFVFSIGSAHTSTDSSNFYLIDNIDFEKASDQDKRIIDSCLTIYHNTTEKGPKLEILNHLISSVWEESIWGEYNDYILTILEQELPNAKAIKDTGIFRLYASSLNNKGLLLNQNGNPDSAVIYYKKSLVYKMNYSPLREIPPVYNNLGSIYHSQGKYQEAVNMYMKGLSILEKADKKNGIGYFYNNLGALYYDQKDYDNAIYFHKKGLAVRSELKDTFAMCSSMSNLAFAYFNNNQEQKAIDLQEECLAIRRKVRDKRGLHHSLIMLAEFYYSKGNKLKSLQLASESYTISKEIQYKKGIISSLRQIAILEYENSNLIKARTNALEAMKLAKEVNHIIELRHVSEILYKIEDKIGNYKKALDAHKLFIQLKDSIDNKKNTRELIKQQFKYDYDQKEALMQNELANAKAKHEIANQKSKFYSTITISILSFLILIGLLLYIIQKNKAKRQIFNLKNQALRLQINPHFLFNAMNSINNFISKNKPKEANQYLTKFAKVMRLSLESVQEDNISIKKEIDFLTNYIDIEKLRHKNFNYTINVDDDLDIHKTAIPPILIQPFIENSILHGFIDKDQDNKGNLEINFTKQQNNVFITIKDDGVGMKKTSLLKKVSNHKSLALSITQKRLNIVNKKKTAISFSSDQNSMGTIINFTLPYTNLMTNLASS